MRLEPTEPVNSVEVRGDFAAALFTYGESDQTVFKREWMEL